MKPVRMRYLSKTGHDAIVEHFVRCCPVALGHEDAPVFFAGLCVLIDREIERALQRPRRPAKRPRGIARRLR